MTEPRLKTELWVQAQVRICDLQFLPIVVRRRGDPDAGAILLRLLRDRGQSLLLKRIAGSGGMPAWMAVGGTGAIDEPAAEAYIAREAGRDDDLWVVEIDDPKERYVLDGRIES